MSTDDTWVLELFRIVDAKDAAAFARLCAEDAALRFGNHAPILGRRQIEEGLREFYSSLERLQHDITGVWYGKWEGGEVKSVESFVTYTRKDGSVTPPIPVTTTIRIEENRIKDYRIFMDISPLSGHA